MRFRIDGRVIARINLALATRADTCAQPDQFRSDFSLTLPSVFKLRLKYLPMAVFSSIDRAEPW